MWVATWTMTPLKPTEAPRETVEFMLKKAK